MTSTDLLNHVEHIALELSGGVEESEWAFRWHTDNCGMWDEEDETLSEHLYWCDERPSAGDWLEDALDIEYSFNQGGDFLGARILVTFGGPNIWVDTRFERVEGFWGGESWTTSYTDSMGLHEFLEEHAAYMAADALRGRGY